MAKGVVPSPRASLTRWDGITHAIVDILGESRMYFDAASAESLARTTRMSFTVLARCGRRSKYSGNTANKITSNPVTCLWCAAERNL